MITMITKEEKSKIGKRSRKHGKDFEKKVRAYLEKQGWIVDRWTNQVEFLMDVEPTCPMKEFAGVPLNLGRLVPAKPKFVYDPILKRRIPISLSSGFPDFIAFRINNTSIDVRNDKIHLGNHLYEVIGVEAKLTELDKEEKSKAKWMIENNVFSEIFVASPGEKRGTIKLEKFKPE